MLLSPCEEFQKPRLSEMHFSSSVQPMLRSVDALRSIIQSGVSAQLSHNVWVDVMGQKSS